MTVGINPVIANQFLDSLFSAAAFTAPAASYIQLHTGDPGVAGTANVSSYATRTLISVWGTAAGGTKSITASVTITASWSGTNGEVLTHVSYWSAVTGGTFVTSDQLLQAQTMLTGAPLSLPSLSAPFTPLAA
jgi:hypothetical protein